MTETKTVRVLIEGRVQGVWYRGWTIEQASARGLAGWVRNLSSGAVEALFHGPAVVVDDMIAACRHGPSAAQVSAVTETACTEAVGHGFHQRPTV
ncbi:Acylphosphatase [Candidatus Terasakiella magnetica]|nr:Acylphosphatase [Candidatus Terasakiella magnetica]